MYLIRAKHNTEQIFSQNLEIKDLSSKATFPNSSLGAGLFCVARTGLSLIHI